MRKVGEVLGVGLFVYVGISVYSGIMVAGGAHGRADYFWHFPLYVMSVLLHH